VFKANLVSDAGEKSRGSPEGVVAMCPEVILGPVFLRTRALILGPFISAQHTSDGYLAQITNDRDRALLQADLQSPEGEEAALYIKN
jgi:hypothetical protein